RSAAYAVRWVAKNIVDAKLATRCEVQVAYAIGVADPVSIMVHTFGTGVVSDDRLERIVGEGFDLTPAGIIPPVKRRRPMYRPTAAYGHLGRKSVTAKVSDKKVQLFPWEESTKVRDLLSAAKV